VRSLQDKLMLYERAIELRKQGMSYSRIGKMLGIGKDTIGSWVRGSPPVRVWRYVPNLSPSSDLAYLLGFYYGDGRSAGEEPKVRFKLADRRQLEFVNEIVARLLGREPIPISMEDAFYVADYDSVVLSGYLESPLALQMDCISGYKKEFLMGLFDAEGYATCAVNHDRRSVSSFQVGVANTRTDYICLIKDLLGELGITGKVRKTNRAGGKMTIRGKTWVRRHDVYHLIISTHEQIKRFLRLVGFSNRSKLEKLGDLVAMIGMPPKQRYPWFRDNYRRNGRKWVRTCDTRIK